MTHAFRLRENAREISKRSNIFCGDICRCAAAPRFNDAIRDRKLIEHPRHAADRKIITLQCNQRERCLERITWRSAA
jgi:hypothetical protein